MLPQLYTAAPRAPSASAELQWVSFAVSDRDPNAKLRFLLAEKEEVSFFKSTTDWQWSFFERLLVFVAISDPPKTMALAFEGPDLLLICFMGGLLAENFDLELSKRITKRRASEVGGFEIRGFASNTSLLIDNMESPLRHYKIKYKSCHPPAWCLALPAPFATGRETAACRMRPCRCKGRLTAPSSHHTRRRGPQWHQKHSQSLSMSRLVSGHGRRDASPNSWDFNRLDIVPALGIHW